MTAAVDSQPSVWYWVICVVLLVWGVLGTLVYAALLVETPEQYAAGVENAAHEQIYAEYVRNIPVWAFAVGIAAAACRLFGAVGLLMQSAWAPPLYVLSLIFFLAALFRAFVLSNAAEAMSARHIAIEVVFVGLTLFAIWFAYANKAKGVLG